MLHKLLNRQGIYYQIWKTWFQLRCLQRCSAIYQQCANNRKKSQLLQGWWKNWIHKFSMVLNFQDSNRFVGFTKWQVDLFLLRDFTQTENKSKSISKVNTHWRQEIFLQLYYQGKMILHFATCMASAGDLFLRRCQARGSESKTVMTDVELPFLVLFPQEIWGNL